jgi:DnaK suppressor protein
MPTPKPRIAAANAQVDRTDLRATQGLRDLQPGREVWRGAAAAREMHCARHMVTTASRDIRNRLHARRRELLARYRTLLALAEEEQQPESELIDAANEQWDLQVLSRMSDSDAHVLANIVEALHRLSAGSYGMCVDCDEKIADARLAAVPEAERCIACAESAERLRSVG